MVSTEHKELSDFVKSIHQQLRDEAKLVGNEQAWKKHCSQENILKKYASAMKELANHWENNGKKDSKVVCRVQWTYETCQVYFNNSILKYREKERDIAAKNNVTCSDKFLGAQEKLKLLDVGSCYNPFKNYPCFEVTALDIAPANKEVLKCDFLSLKVANKSLIMNQELVQAEKNSFHVIVFSLLLEYLPSPKQRFNCCLKAYNLLQFEGLLVIITPDSKHVGANAKFMKSWRHILARMGFSRIKYEKLPYIHAMVFRKALSKEVTNRWVELHKSDDVFEKIYIPQDFKKD